MQIFISLTDLRHEGFCIVECNNQQFKNCYQSKKAGDFRQLFLVFDTKKYLAGNLIVNYIIKDKV